MRKLFFLTAVAALALAGCSDDKNKEPDIVIEDDGIKITLENFGKWSGMAQKLADNLASDADNLLKSWQTDFGRIFKQHSGGEYASVNECVDEIIDCCAEVAGDVSGHKLANPYALMAEGRTREALIALESLFSGNDVADYINNITSIRNSYFGSIDGSVAPASLAALTAQLNPALDSQVRGAIAASLKAIAAITQPLSKNLTSPEVKEAMVACAKLEMLLDESLEPMYEKLTGHDAQLQAIVENYVDNVVIPTYSALSQNAGELARAIGMLAAEPSNANFAVVAKAWVATRAAWELGAAFEFGPFEALDFEKKMNAALNTSSLNAALVSGNLGAADSGLLALQYLIFSNGQPRHLEY